MRAFRKTIGILAFAGVVGVLTPAAAMADSADRPVATRTVAPAAHQQLRAGWIGDCYVSRYTTYAGGWCDGNGPDWTYEGTVRCSNGSWYNNGPNRWAGDRRGSYSTCPSGSATRGGVDVFYRGSYRYSALV